MRKLFVTLIAVLLLAATAFGQRGMRQGAGGDCDGDRKGKGHGMSCDFDGPGGGHGMRGHCGGDRGGFGHIMAMAEELELSDQQIDKMKQSMEEFQMERIDREAELKKARLQLRMLMNDPDASEVTVMKTIENVSGLRGEMQKMQYQHRKSIESILTAEQLDKLKERKPNPPGDGTGRSFKQRRGFGG
ncbi:MAG: hypothetical protein P1R58_00415 [bacterium]|nr:hypothetical protein [bacterium]